MKSRCNTRLIVVSVVISAVTTFLMTFSRDFTIFLILTVVRAIATGPIMAVIPALASGLTPQDEAGQYLAYCNMTTALPSAFAALLFGAFLNMGGAFTPASFVMLLFAAAGFFPAWRHCLRMEGFTGDTLKDPITQRSYHVILFTPTCRGAAG